MTLLLEPAHLTAIARHAEADYPSEACGLIGGIVDGARQVAVQLVPLPNARSDAARNRYLIDPDAFRRAAARLDRDDLDIVGVYHSHPDHPSVPSAFDRDHAWPRLVYLIVPVGRGRAGAARAWMLSDDRAAFGEVPITIEPRTVAWQSRS